VFLAQARYQFRNTFAVGFAHEGAVGEALAVILNQLRKFFLQKGKEDAGRGCWTSPKSKPVVG
jgi:hypothetical protein